MIYAQYILKLKALKPLDQDPDAAELGNIIHQALEKFTTRWPRTLPADAHEQLLACGRESFADVIDRPAIASLWWPRFEAMVSWIIEQEKKRRGGITQVMGELQGQWKFEVDNRPFVLTTRIDRLELCNNGESLIADYKTGSIPLKIDIERGLASQLPLEALIARHGTLSSPAAVNNIQMEYWKLAGKRDDCAIIPVLVDLQQTQQRLETLIRRFDQASEPYAAQTQWSLLPRYNDYAHLTRRQEWEAA